MTASLSLPPQSRSSAAVSFHLPAILMWCLTVLVFTPETARAVQADAADLLLEQEGKAAAERSVPIRAIMNREPPSDVSLEVKNWTLSFRGSFDVPMACGRAWYEGKSVSVFIKSATEVTLASMGGPAEITFQTHDALVRCIGLESSIRFPDDDWVPFFHAEYRGGGFEVTSEGFQFEAGTQARTKDGRLWASDGSSWSAVP